MKKNVGNVDRVVRFIIGVILLLVGLLDMKGVAQIIFIVLAIAMFATSAFRLCSVYKIFGISTCKLDN